LTQDRYVYLNGAISEERRALISPFDRGFLWGDGVYEVTACFHGRPFRLSDHLDRLERSMRYVGIDLPLSRQELEKATFSVLEANSLNASSRGIHKIGHWVTRGRETEAMIARAAGPPTILIFLWPAHNEARAEDYSRGVQLHVVTTRRPPQQSVETRAKVTSKMNQILAELDADASNSLSLMLDVNGKVAENAIANFFIVHDGRIRTPRRENILEGVTRKVVIELAERLRIPFEEGDLTMYDVAQADEMFITSSTTGVTPVRQVDRFRPRCHAPGAVTIRLIEALSHETGYDFISAVSRGSNESSSTSEREEAS
jgi:branched-chain amino acid aminotransferase